MAVDETENGVPDAAPLSIFNLTRLPKDYVVGEQISHLVGLTSGQALFTTLDLYSTIEADYYVEYLMEEDPEVVCARYEWESDSGPLPLSTNPLRSPIPPLGIFEESPEFNYARRLLWLNYKSTHLQNSEHLGSARGAAVFAEEWRSRLSPGKRLRKLLKTSSSPSSEDLIGLGLLSYTQEDWDKEAWCLRTFHFRRDVELLLFRRHRKITESTLETRPREWAQLRDSIRRIWGTDSTLYPSYDEPQFLDHSDELYRERHWRALARLLRNSVLPPLLHERISLALGGSVKNEYVDTEVVVLEVLSSLSLLDFKRELNTFVSRT
ncbi:hypothetical protein QCA50_003237 [Cerrena zonata]|uniref:Uncharacterized protein n=1 Tax=Cerrena zonata TaxID=2478898 RepID=A0AAW0GM06_9APHY